MVYDFEEGRILGELQELEDEINAVQYLVDRIKPDDSYIKLSACLRLLEKLKREMERQQMRLKLHRQKVKESGIKY